MAPKDKKKTETKMLTEAQRIDHATKIVEHVFAKPLADALAPVIVADVFALIAVDAAEEDLLGLTEELAAVKECLGNATPPDQVLLVHSLLVEDEDGPMLETAEEIAEEIAETTTYLDELFGKVPDATACLIAWLGTGMDAEETSTDVVTSTKKMVASVFGDEAAADPLNVITWLGARAA